MFMMADPSRHLDDYSAIVSQFGHMTMFVSAFPLCTVLSFINNVQLQMHVVDTDLHRAILLSAQDIGMWFKVLS